MVRDHRHDPDVVLRCQRTWRSEYQTGQSGLTADTDARVARRAAAKRGKANWARGLTASSDERVRRNAESRRGKQRGPSRLQQLAVRSFEPVRYLGSEGRADHAYLLGLYLGDGSIVSKTNRLEISLDARYPGIIYSCAAVMRRLHPRGRVAIRNKGEGCRGRVLLRRIRLIGWQIGIVDEHPFSLLRGLVESDGGRFERVVNSVTYPAYEFTNESHDIREIFCRTARSIGLGFTLAKQNVI